MTTFLPVQVSTLRDIGWSLWDPIGLLPQGASWRDEACRAFADEYDAYLTQAAGLIYKGAADREVIRYLVEIETEHMGLGSRDDDTSRVQAVVDALRVEAGMPNSVLGDIPGGELLLDWFGRVPHFHDAKLLEISFAGRGAGLLRIHTWNMTDKVDSKGYFVLDKHAIVTIALEGVNAINCIDFDMVPGIIFDLEITRVGEHFCIEWSASYGVNGSVTAKHALINLAPGQPD